MKNYRNNKRMTFRDKNGYSWGEPAVASSVETRFDTAKVGAPEGEKTSNESKLLQSIAFRELKFTGQIEVKADPYVDISSPTTPYQIINDTNKVFEASYPGIQNIQGNSIVELQNSLRSGLLNYFDAVTANFRINYLYACYDNTLEVNKSNLAVNLELYKAVNEALSKGYSTMFTQLAFYTDTIESADFPKPTNASIDDNTYYKMVALLHYQTVAQNIVSPIAKYISMRSAEDSAMNMSYRREAPLITALYGLFKKAAFIATINAIGSSIKTLYFDDNWYRQINSIFSQISRKSNSITEPLISLTATHRIPKLKIKAAGSSSYYYDSDTVLVTSKGNWINPDTFEISNGTTLTLEQLVYTLNRMLDITTILRWARMYSTDPTSTKTITSPSAYYQQVNRLIEELNNIAVKFNSYVVEINTFLDKLRESGLVYWKTGLTLNVEKITKASPGYNKMIHDIVTNYLSGCSDVSFDDQTRRWKLHTMWNKYTGLAKFDKFSGGSFLTFGLRNLDTTNVKGEVVNAQSTILLVPVLFGAQIQDGYNKCLAITRTGAQATITSEDVSTTDTKWMNSVLGRLTPLGNQFKVKLPKISIDSANAKIKSYASYLLLNLFGYGAIVTGSNTYDYVIDQDILCFLDLEVDDVSNAMITFCRNYSPFRLSTGDPSRTMGFLTLKG